MKRRLQLQLQLHQDIFSDLLRFCYPLPQLRCCYLNKKIRKKQRSVLLDDGVTKNIIRKACFYGYFKECVHFQDLLGGYEISNEDIFDGAAKGGYIRLFIYVHPCNDDIYTHAIFEDLYNPTDIVNELLWSSAKSGHIKLCKYFFQNGGHDVNHALAQGASGGHLNICQFFLSKGAKTINTSFRWAAFSGHIDICEFLFQVSSSLRQKEDELETRYLINLDEALKISCRKSIKRLDSCEYLVKKGANPNIGLIESTNFNNKSLCEFFISKGANDFNSGLLHAACNSQSIDLCKYFIQLGATNFKEALMSLSMDTSKTIPIYQLLMSYLSK